VRLLVLCFLAAGLVTAQTEKPRSAAAPSPEKHAPQTPRELAEQLLASAHVAVGKAQPGAQAALLWRIGDLYVLFDKKKALEILEQAFSVAGAASGPIDGQLETFIVKSVSDLDLKRGVELVHAMPPDSRSSAISAVVRKLIAKDKIDDATELVNAGAGMHYPFDAASGLLRALKDDDDPRRAILFGNAITGYQANPSREFGQLLAEHWKHFPAASVIQALDAIVTTVSGYKEAATIFKISMSGAKGSADLNTEQEIELFDVIVPLEALEPGRLEDLYKKYPGLKATEDLFPDGPYTKGAASSYSGVIGLSASEKASSAQDTGQFNTSITLSQQAEELALTNLPKAIDKIKLIPLSLYQGTTLMAIAEQRLESDSTVARDLLSKAMAILADGNVEQGDGVAQALTKAAEDAHKLKDDALTREALDLAFDTAGKLLKRDVDPEDPNTNPEDMWPSAHNYRNAIRKAAEIYGMGATAFLERIQNPDMYLFAQVALAAGLLNREQSETWGSHSRKVRN